MANDSTTVAVVVGQIRSRRSGPDPLARHERIRVGHESPMYANVFQLYDADTGNACGGWGADGIRDSYPDVIGIETLAGRVMVGERRECPSGVVCTIDRVGDEERVFFSIGARSQGSILAHYLARWPLLPPTPPDAEATERKLEPASEHGPGHGCPACTAQDAALAECERIMTVTICGPSADPREQGPGIERLPVPQSTVRPDVVVCAEWDRWALP